MPRLQQAIERPSFWASPGDHWEVRVLETNGSRHVRVASDSTQRPLSVWHIIGTCGSFAEVAPMSIVSRYQECVNL